MNPSVCGYPQFLIGYLKTLSFTSVHATLGYLAGYPFSSLGVSPSEHTKGLTMKKPSDLTFKNAKPKDKNYKLYAESGLYLLVKTNGSKLWHVKYAFGRKEKCLSLGPYPLVTLAEAREGRDAAKKLLRLGIDPSTDKQEKRQQQTDKSKNSFRNIALEWHENRKTRWSPTHASDVLAKLERDIFPCLGHLPIAVIEVPDVLRPIRQIEARKALETAHRARQIIGQVLRYGVATGKCTRDIAADVKDALVPKLDTKHFACLPLEEIPQFLRDLSSNKARLFPITTKAIELLMLTFVRTQELIGATWDEFDLDNAVWHIPAHSMKMKQAHIVPLSTQVLSLLREVKPISEALGSNFILPSPSKANKPISNNTILRGLKYMGYGGRQTGHGFRALAMTTIKEQLGYRHEVIDRQLAHEPENKVTAAYDRAQFMDQRRTMMQEYADYLDSLRKGSSTPALKAA